MSRGVVYDAASPALEDVGGSAFHGQISAVRTTRKTAQEQRDRAPPWNPRLVTAVISGEIARTMPSVARAES